MTTSPFFQAVQSALSKKTWDGNKSPEDMDAAIRQLVSRAILASDEIIDVFTMAGLEKPDFGLLGECFLAVVRKLERKRWRPSRPKINVRLN